MRTNRTFHQLAAGFVVPPLGGQNGGRARPPEGGTTNEAFHTHPRAGRSARFRGQEALSLIEIMVAVALLAVIILGLVAMFNQTRKAFTLGLTTADYQDSGRVVMDMTPRELEQLTPTGLSNGVNFYVDTPASFKPHPWPLVQTNPPPPDVMTPTLERLYFVTRYNQQWNVSGYFIDPTSISNGVGTLYRYGGNNVSVSNINNGKYLADFTNHVFQLLPFNRIIDGVVDFRVRAYTPLGTNNPQGFPYTVSGILVYGTNGIGSNYTIIARYDTNGSGDFDYLFRSNAVPGYVELELGVLEPRTLERWRALSGNAAAQLDFLTNHAGQVHVFRQRIPIRSVDTSAYP